MQERRRALLYGGSDSGNLLPGEFSVSATKKIKFSKGNLVATITEQVSGTEYYLGTWDIAENQYDFATVQSTTPFAIGSKLYLFGWVGDRAAFDSYGLFSNEQNAQMYYLGDSLKTDWGNIPNLVSKIGSGYRTFTQSEITYLVGERTNASSLKGTGTVNNIKGNLLLPDNWSCPSGCYFSSTANNFTTNTYNLNQWKLMEDAGAVFLPTGFYRIGNRTYASSTGNNYGYYWTSTHRDGYSVSYILTTGLYAFNVSTISQYYGMAVRLIKDV